MIEVEREADHVGPVKPDGTQKWRWHVRGKPAIEGLSREPLLDACRELKRMGAHPQEAVGLFRPGSSIPDLKTTVGYGSSRIIEQNRTSSPPFIPYKPHPKAG